MRCGSARVEWLSHHQHAATGERRRPRTPRRAEDAEYGSRAEASSTSAEGRPRRCSGQGRGPQRASRARPRDAGGLPAFGRQPRIEAARRSASRRERMSGLRSSARPRSAAAQRAAHPPLGGPGYRGVHDTRLPLRYSATLGRSKAALCAPWSSARSAASGGLTQRGLGLHALLTSIVLSCSNHSAF